MIRLRWGLAALATVVAAIVGVFTYAQSGSGHEPLGVGLVDTAHVGAAHALVVGLAPLPGTTVDPYASACLAPAALCDTSTLAPRTLLDEADAALAAAGARQLTLHCPPNGVGGPLDCVAVYDFHGAHIDVMAGGHGPSLSYLALRTYTPPVPVGPVPAHAIKPLADWASVNPFPAPWRLSATCFKTSPAGCLQYRHPYAQGAPIASPLEQACADARGAIATAGYQLHSWSSYGATADHPAWCQVTGSRYRTAGGGDSSLVVIWLRAVDPTHVTVLADVSAS